MICGGGDEGGLTTWIQSNEPMTEGLRKNRKKKHVVVLGGGFGGLEFCKRMKNSGRFHITLIDRQNHHLFQPLLYQVASAGLAAPEIAQPLRSILSDRDDLDVLMDEVMGIELENRVVVTKERRIDYDYLIIALGVKNSYFGHDDWAQYTQGLKSLDDATDIRRNILQTFEEAESSDDPAEVERLLTVAVIGGGPTGVELAGAFAELARRVFPGDFRRIDPTKARIIIIEAMPRLLNVYPESLSDYTRKRLEKMGVTVLTGTPVSDIGEGFLVLEDGTRIESENIIWAAGMQAPELIRNLNVESDRAGRLKVNPDLSLPDHPEVFAIGDIANVCDKDGNVVPGLCPAAIQMGKHTAKVIRDYAEEPSENRPAFNYFDKGSMATIGRSAAVAESGGLKFTGFIAWLMWLGIHLLFLIGFRNRLAVLMQWFYSYITYKRGARIITGVETEY